ncbi:MAG: rhomboid family intramembrane serine protease [Acidimicrobiia bacterium]
MVIPLHDDNPTGRRPVVTIILIALNLFVFALLQPHGDAVDEARFNYERAAIPCELRQGEPLTVEELTTGECGDVALASPEIFPEKNVYLAVLVSIFLHGSWLHVLGNMLFLWVFGNNVEERLGHAGFLIFFLFVGVVATLGHVAADPSATIPLVGASGAIAGVMGAYLVFWPRARIHSLVFVVFLPLPAALVLGIWFVLQFGTDAGSNVAWVAHVTGFVAGALVALVLRAAGGPLRGPTFPSHPAGGPPFGEPPDGEPPRFGGRVDPWS